MKVADLHEDGRRTNIGLLSRRAAGFIWHFSFFVNFTAETRKVELKDAILLLDEPGLHLHPAQQAGTLDVLKHLARDNQIIYTTHSPFMIFDYTVGNLLTVELDHNTHLSTIRSSYWDSDPDTLIPILHALGAPEAFSSAVRSISRRPIVILEGITDYHYISGVIDLMARKDQRAPHNLSAVNLVQANGSSAIGPLALFHKGRGREVVALYDKEPRATQHADELRRQGFPEEKICFCRMNNKQECDIEDLFTEVEYLEAVNRLYGELLKDSKYVPLTGEMVKAKKHAQQSLIRIVPVLEAIWADHKQDNWGSFDKKRVCEKLCDMIFENQDFLSKKTLERFSALLTDLAGALSPPASEAQAEPEEGAAKATKGRSSAKTAQS